MNIKEIKNQSLTGLNNLLADLKQKKEEMEFKVAQGQLKNVRELRIVKKDIARILMMLAVKKDKSLLENNTDTQTVKKETTK